MVDAIVSAASQKIFEALEQRASLFLGATGELEKLSFTFQSIEALLHDAESKQLASESVRLWLSRLKQAAYDIDDLLGEPLIPGLENEASDADSTSGIKVFAKLFAMVSRYKVAWQVKEIRERLDQIADDKIKYSFSTNGSSGADGMPGSSQLPMTSLMASSEMIGRMYDKQILISQLVGGSSQEDGKVRIIAIVGIGGLGKTTLAQEICSSKEVKDHFKRIVWVCVTENFDIIRIMKAILEGLEGESTSLSELGSLQGKLCEALEGKCFLLVLDDVWNEDDEKWKALRLSLTSGASGSRILVTTRNANVGSAMAAAYVHELNGLSDIHCWKLFSSRAFGGWKKEDRSKFEKIGKEIAKKCEGVPLLAQVMGSAMKSKRKVQDWENILHSEIWSLPEVTQKMLSVMLLSYCNLPTHLKQCFKYCSIFPKDEELAKDMVIRLWVAQGFIQSKDKRELEDIGIEYFDDLVARSMIQVVERYGVFKYKVHDCLHDLAQLISKDEIGIYAGGNSEKCSINVHHASIFFTDKKPSIPFALQGGKKLRTLYLNKVQKIDKSLVNLFRRARLLRALHFSASKIQMLPKSIGKLYRLRYLDLSFSEIEKLPDGIGKLKYLRYLDVSHSKIIELPKSTSHLRNLHCLKLNSCGELQRLPRGMGGMVSLRHLEITKTDKLECLPKGLGSISSLRSLCKFIVGGKGGCGLRELQRLNDLEGSLTIVLKTQQLEQMERAFSEEEARKAQLWNKEYLTTLHLSISGNGEIKTMDGVLEGLQPHPNLQVLKIHCESSSKLPSWIGDSSFSKLTNATIDGFIHCKHLHGLGKLPALKYLHIEKVSIEDLGREFYYGSSSSDVGGRGTPAFPKLEELVLQNMSEFEKWESASEHDPDMLMPSLRVLKLRHCPKLESLPHHLAKNPLKDLTITECYNIKGGAGCCFPLLEELRLTDSSEFFSGGLPDLPRLEKFIIVQMKNKELTDEGWERLESLEELQILSCSKLESLPKGLGQLTALQTLEIVNLEALIHLPDELGQLKSLQTLRIDECPKLESLPDGIDELNALRSLKITNCKALGSLLRGLYVLPNHLQLEIRGCPKWSETREWRGEWKKRKVDDSSNVDENSARDRREEGEGDDSGSDRDRRKEDEGDDSGSDRDQRKEGEGDDSGSDIYEWNEETVVAAADHSGSDRDDDKERVADDSGSERVDNDLDSERDVWEERAGDDSERENGEEKEGDDHSSERDDQPEVRYAFGMYDWVQTDYWAQMESKIDEAGNSCSIS